MSIVKRVGRDENGEVVVTITIRGSYDANRFAWAMMHLQCEFADCGRRIQNSLRRMVGAEVHDKQLAHLGVPQRGRTRKPQPLAAAAVGEEPKP